MRVADNAFRSGQESPLKLDGLLLLGCQRELVLEESERSGGTRSLR